MEKKKESQFCDYLPQIENRFEPLALIEQLLDDNHLVFRYNVKLI